MDRLLLHRARSRGPGRITVAVLTAVVLATVAGTAAALTVTALTVAKRTVNGRSAMIVVDDRGVTVYELGGESLAHLQCINRACFNTWPPLKVSSVSAQVQTETGVPGTLSVMHRIKGGFYQLMLDRHPLYYYSGDRGTSGLTKGQGRSSYGGTWHVVGSG